jgi:hypothetical protein
VTKKSLNLEIRRRTKRKKKTTRKKRPMTMKPSPKAGNVELRRPQSVCAEDSDDDDGDNELDDVPLAHLVSAKKKAKTAESKKKADAKKAASPKQKSAPAASKKVSTKPAEPVKKPSNEDYRTLSAALFSSECAKGQLIQKLLCRWWYAFQWPTNLPEKPPKGYDLMDGMPGVYVCVEGNDVGKIKDLRDMKSKPSFSNFLVQRVSEELKDATDWGCSRANRCVGRSRRGGRCPARRS